MESWAIAVVVVVVLLVAAAVAYWFVTRRRREQLRERFGSEYDRTVESAGGRRAAERDLAERAELRDRLDVRDLSAREQGEFLARWEHVQAEFVDDPAHAVERGDELIRDVMRSRGYPVDEPERMATLVSVDHPDLVEQYRRASGIHSRHLLGEASTDDLREAMVCYRLIFDALVHGEDREPDELDTEQRNMLRERRWT